MTGKNILLRIVSAYYSAGLRGGTRLFDFLAAHIDSFHEVYITTNNGIVVGDLRLPGYRALLRGTRDQTEEELIMRRFIKPGAVAYDIGVYLGIYTTLMSGLVGRNGVVHAFEPNRMVIPSLRRTAEALGNVVLHEVALSDEDGAQKLFVPNTDGSMTSLVNWTESSLNDIEVIGCTSAKLDRWIRDTSTPRPDFIKCDVEGAEYKVMIGGMETLNQVNAPVIVFEVNPNAAVSFGHGPDACLQLLKSFHRSEYRFFQVVNRDFRAVNDFENLLFNPYGFTNVVAVPRTKGWPDETEQDR